MSYSEFKSAVKVEEKNKKKFWSHISYGWLGRFFSYLKHDGVSYLLGIHTVISSIPVRELSGNRKSGAGGDFFVPVEYTMSVKEASWAALLITMCHDSNKK